MSEAGTLSFQYASPAQQREAVTLGMWAFLATEVLFFGALIAAYFNYRIWFGAEFIAAARLTKVVLGTINTAVLLTSSLTLSFAEFSAREGNQRMLGLGISKVKDTLDHLLFARFDLSFSFCIGQE